MRKYLIVAILFLSSCQKNTLVDAPPLVDFKGEILFSTFYSDALGYGWQLNLVNADGTNRKIFPNKLMLYSGGFPSHNGKKIAYNVPNNVGTSDLYIIDIDGQNETLVSRNAYGKEWSPDDTHIAFMRSHPGSDDVDIYTINTDGINELKLTDQHRNSFPQFLPDNSGIIFDSSPDLYSINFGIYKMNLDGSNKRLLTPANKSYTTPIVSPDGKKIAAFVYSACNCKELVMMNPDGSGLKQITFGGTNCVSPSWSPDSRRLAYTVKKSQSADIYVCNADGTGTTKITDGSYGNDCPTWSKDGNYIAYMSGRATLPGERERSDIWISRADGLSHARVTNNINGFIFPVIIQK